MKKPYLPYKKELRQLSRNLRSNSTLSEVFLWNELKAGKLRGYKFNRQKPLRKYIVDFYCKKLNLVIEIDTTFCFPAVYPRFDESWIRRTAGVVCRQTGL